MRIKTPNLQLLQLGPPCRKLQVGFEKQTIQGGGEDVEKTDEKKWDVELASFSMGDKYSFRIFRMPHVRADIVFAHHQLDVCFKRIKCYHFFPLIFKPPLFKGFQMSVRDAHWRDPWGAPFRETDSEQCCCEWSFSMEGQRQIENDGWRKRWAKSNLFSNMVLFWISIL